MMTDSHSRFVYLLHDFVRYDGVCGDGEGERGGVVEWSALMIWNW